MAQFHEGDPGGAGLNQHALGVGDAKDGKDGQQVLQASQEVEVLRASHKVLDASAVGSWLLIPAIVSLTATFVPIRIAVQRMGELER